MSVSSLAPSVSQRPSWDATWLAVADVVGQRSLCSRDRVGAVIVDPLNRVVATGYNGPPAGFQHEERPCVEWCKRAQTNVHSALGRAAQDVLIDPGYVDCPALHAEANALSVCDRSVREGGTIYVTSHSCFSCAKLIANSGLAVVIIGLVAGDRDREYRDPTRSYEFMERCGLTVIIQPLERTAE